MPGPKEWVGRRGSNGGHLSFFQGWRPGKEPSLTYILLLSESSPHAAIWMQCPAATRERRCDR